jgi:hypothetical protein
MYLLGCIIIINLTAIIRLKCKTLHNATKTKKRLSLFVRKTLSTLFFLFYQHK